LSFPRCPPPFSSTIIPQFVEEFNPALDWSLLKTKITIRII